MTQSHNDKTWLQGYWLKMHFDARFTDLNPEGRNHFVNNIKYNSATFPCDECRPHFIKYVSDNPPENDESMLYWTVKFHNAVNKRLGKKEFTMDEALATYTIGTEIRPACASCGNTPSKGKWNKISIRKLVVNGNQSGNN